MRPLLIITLFSILISCNSPRKEDNNEKKSKIDTAFFKKDTTDNLSLKADTFILHPKGYKDISKFCDTTINKIEFDNCQKITKMFGDKFELLPDIDDLPSLEVISNDKTQLLTMFMWNGSAKCHFEQYQVEYLNSKKKFYQKPFSINENTFISGRDIYLGMTQTDLKEKIGIPNETKTEKGVTIYSYQQFNDLYFADYCFKNNKLIKFRFGFEYP